MVYTKNLVAVCAGRDAVRAAAQGMQVLHLCLGLSENGALERRQLPAMQRGCFLGLCDPPRGLRLCSPERLALDLAFEAKRVNAPGVFADFERETAQTLALLRAFDEALAEDGIPLYVPVNIGRDLEHAVLTVSTALSGGSLTAYFSSLQGIYGAHRVAAFLQPVSQDFTLPSASPDGKPLSAAARAALLAETGAQVFFSHELCARYFTYTDREGAAHFVLFDDADTLAAKLAQLLDLAVHFVDAHCLILLNLRVRSAAGGSEYLSRREFLSIFSVPALTVSR